VAQGEPLYQALILTSDHIAPVDSGTPSDSK
jgi:hypothetical protein